MKILLFLLLASTSFAQGVERWPVKVLADGAELDTAVHSSTVAAQNALTRPVGNWLTLPRQADESTLTEVSGMLTEYGIESDRDYHLVLSDKGKTMICEIPDPTIPALKHNVHRAEWTQARSFIDATFGKPTHTVKAAKHQKRVTVRGYGLYDKPAHGTGHAANGREIHPVLSISIGQ